MFVRTAGEARCADVITVQTCNNHDLPPNSSIYQELQLHFSAQISVQFIFLTCHYDRRGTGVGIPSASATCVRSSPKMELKQCACYNVSVMYISQLQGQQFCWCSHCFLTLFWNSLHAMEHKNSSQCSQQSAICPSQNHTNPVHSFLIPFN